jgi:hypothetical protein
VWLRAWLRTSLLLAVGCRARWQLAVGLLWLWLVVLICIWHGVAMMLLLSVSGGVLCAFSPSFVATSLCSMLLVALATFTMIRLNAPCPQLFFVKEMTEGCKSPDSAAGIVVVSRSLHRAFLQAFSLRRLHYVKGTLHVISLLGEKTHQAAHRSLVCGVGTKGCPESRLRSIDIPTLLDEQGAKAEECTAVARVGSDGRPERRLGAVNVSARLHDKQEAQFTVGG